MSILFRTIPGNHCGLGSFANHVHNKNVPISEAEIFFLGSVWDFVVVERPFVCLSIDAFSSIYGFIEATGNTLIAENEHSLSSGRQFLETVLIAGETISINIAPPKCNYYPGRRILCQGDLVHYINPLELKHDRLLISDCYILYMFEVNTHLGWTSVDEICEAWKISGFEYFLYPEAFWSSVGSSDVVCDRHRLLLASIQRCAESLVKLDGSLYRTKHIFVDQKSTVEAILAELFDCELERFLVYLAEILSAAGGQSKYKALSFSVRDVLRDFRANAWLLLKSAVRQDQEQFETGLDRLYFLQKRLLEALGTLL